MSLIEKNWKNMFTLSLGFFNIDVSLIDDKEVIRSLEQRGIKAEERGKHLENFQSFRESVQQISTFSLDEFEHKSLRLISFYRTGKSILFIYNQKIKVLNSSNLRPFDEFGERICDKHA